MSVGASHFLKAIRPPICRTSTCVALPEWPCASRASIGSCGSPSQSSAAYNSCAHRMPITPQPAEELRARGRAGRGASFGSKDDYGDDPGDHRDPQGKRAEAHDERENRDHGNPGYGLAFEACNSGHTRTSSGEMGVSSSMPDSSTAAFLSESAYDLMGSPNEQCAWGKARGDRGRWKML